MDLNQTSGEWELTFTSDPSLTDTFDMLVFVKASDRYVDYFFNDETFTTNGVGEGTFTISFLNNGGQIPELSHLDIAFRDGTDDGTPVPNPTALLLLGAGVMGTVAGRRFINT